MLGTSLYHLIKPAFGQTAPDKTAYSCTCSNNTFDGDCECPAGRSDEQNMVMSSLLLVAVELARLWLLPADFWLQCVVDAVTLSAVNVIALHISRKAEQSVMAALREYHQEQLDDKQQFLLSGDV